MINNNKPFLDHLEEFRVRILYSLAGIIIFTVISFFFNKNILEIISSPLNSDLIFISPHEAFFVSLKAALLAGILVSAPFTAYHIWKFIGIALKNNEKKFLLIYVPVTLILFLGGIFFGFMVVLPLGLKFLLNFGGAALTPMITVEKYVSFVFLILMVFGITFQLPLFMRMVTSIGIVEKTVLQSGRRHAIVIIFIIAAILTPPDIFTQVALALPIIALYEIGLVFAAKNKKLKG